MCQPDNVKSLDSMARRLCRNNVIKSSQYLIKYERLLAADREAVKVLEAQLFEHYSRSDVEVVGHALVHPEIKFERSSGAIWLYWSENKRKYIFTEFVIPGRGGGASGTGSSDEARYYPCTFKVGGAKVAARWVARLVSEGKFLHLNACHQMAADPHSRFRDRSASRLDGIINDFLDKRGAIVPLPDWSVLRTHFRVHQQLENDFARSILAGELLCMLVQSVEQSDCLNAGEFDADFFPDIKEHGKHKIDLFAAVQGIIDFFSDRNVGMRQEYVKYFRTCSIIGNEWWLDDAHSSLIWGEVMFRMASSAAFEYFYFRKKDTSQLMRKISSLSEFARLSKAYFGMDNEYYVPDILEDSSLDERISTDQAAYFIMKISKFSISTQTLVDGLSAIQCEYATSRSGSVEVHHRMLDLAAEILH